MSRWRFGALAIVALGSVRLLACAKEYSIDASDSSAPDATKDVASSTPIEEGGETTSDTGTPTVIEPSDATADASIVDPRPCTKTCRSHFCDDDGGCHPLVFVTPGRFTGRFADAGGTGLAAADALCKSAAGDGGTFIAMLSSAELDLVTRLTETSGGSRPVRRVDGQNVAVSYRDLFTAPAGVVAPIQLTPSGVMVPENDHVWTGTTGLGASAQTCIDWTVSGAQNGTYGLAGPKDGAWISESLESCASVNHLYCAEIVP